MEPIVYRVDELYETLKKESIKGHYYRGQTREFTGPLLPSGHRLLLRSDTPDTIEDDLRLRGVGKKFFFRTNYLDAQQFETEELYKKRLQKEHLKQFIICHTRNALGYALAEAFFQQAGIQSEGLDITEDLKIAFFFAIFEFRSGEYRLKSDHSIPSIIYRWTIDLTPWSLNTLNRYDFYSCPRIIPVHHILRLFDSCDTTREFEESLEEYREAIGWNFASFDLNIINGKRPFQLIKIPRKLVDTSRVEIQQACLLIPDMVLSQEYTKERIFARNAPRLNNKLKNGVFIEDVAAAEDCEKYCFSLEGLQELDWISDINPNKIFPKEDIVFKIIRGWVRTYIQNPMGTIPFFMDPVSLALIAEDYPNNLNKLLKDYETELFF